jgi:D-glycero-beta-D-manno-heptose-7-phosphate kinase
MKSQSQSLLETVRRFRNRTVGVLGDFMLDELLVGEATRISPEAPVPILLLPPEDRRQRFPGGAGNVAANIRALNGMPIPFGAIGRDESGKKLRKLLEDRGVSCRTLVAEPRRVTPRKVRIVAYPHQLLRLDFERPERISPATESELARHISRAMKELDALVISDYRKGTVTTELVERISVLARQRRIPILVDPKPEQPEICRRATLVTPNLREAEAMAGHSMRTSQDLYSYGRRLRAELDCQYLVVTRGGEGMTLFEPSGEVHSIHGTASPVFDVTGAGDTVVAVLALACAAGSSMREAAELANLAAGRVVLKFGTAVISSRDLLEAILSSQARRARS